MKRKHKSTIIEQLEARRMLSASMVKDLNTAPSPISGLWAWVGAGNTVFLSQDDGVAGWELYKTDGTTGGTVLVKDIRPGRDNAQPGSLTYAGGNTIFFTANDGTHGVELWKSDGTTAGTVMVKDIVPGSASSGVGSLVNINGTVFFGANGGVWKTDGTEAGTVLLKSFDSGLSPTQLINNNGTLFFRASTVASGAELWKSDGTPGGTTQVVELYNNNNDGFTNTAMAAMGGFVYFAGRTSAGATDLWRSDGTALNTTKVKDLASSSSTPINIRTSGSRVYFTVSNPGSDFGLWGTDGTTTTSIWSTPSTTILGMTDVSGTLFFGSGTTLYTTTGGAPTTVKTGLTFNSTLVQGWVGNGGILYGGMNDGGGAGDELWRSDGTLAGTQIVKDIEPNLPSSNPTMLVPYGPGGSSGLMVGTFSGPTTIGGAIWKTDGTGPGTVLVKDISPGTDASGPLLLTAFKGYVYFIASEPLHSGGGLLGELYRTDGTEAGTDNFADLNPGPASASVSNLRVYGDNLYFSANDGSGIGKELWRTDGTNVFLVKDIETGPNNSNPSNGVGSGNYYFFPATTAALGEELYRTDGTSGGTLRLTNLATGNFISSMNDFEGWLYYTVSTSSNAFAGLFRTNGIDVLPVANSFTATGSILNVNGTLYISGTTAADGAELFKIAPGTTTPVLVKDIATSGGNSSPSNFANVDGTLFFAATTSSTGAELWKSDGTNAGTVMVKDIRLGSTGSGIQNMVTTNGVAYFRADNGINGVEIWRSDGTTAGTYLLKDIAPPGATSGIPTRPFAANGFLYFAANDDNSSTPEAWRSDGTPEGTLPIAHFPRDTFIIYPANAAFFTALNGNVYFQANDDTHGSELWQSGVPDFATLGAGGVLTITGTATNDVIDVVAHDGAGTVTVTLNGITENFGPGQVSSITVATGIGQDTLNISGGFVAINSDAGAGTANLAIHVASNGAVVFNASQRLRRLDVDGSARLGQGGAKVLVTRGLSVAGELNLTDNDLVLDYDASEANPFADIQGRIVSAYDFGAWDGSGIRTSMADAATGLTTLAIADPAAAFGLGPSDTMDFSGVTIDGTSVVIKYTYAGDANLDGVIDGGDYGVIDNFAQVPNASGYFNGDFNYDGVIDGGDYGIIDNNIQAQGAAL